MNSSLQAALQSDLALATLEDHLIQRAGVLYRLGFIPKRISRSQMAAVGERIRTASSLEEAQRTVTSFLNHQLNKLLAQAERGGQLTSWALPPETSGGEKTLGHTLTLWIEKENYLEGEEMPKGLDRLAALRRFWSRFYGLYRYQTETGDGMSLSFLSEEVHHP